MNGLILAARLILAIVFVVAGFAKLRDREGAAITLEDFGLPDSLARSGAVALPVAELAAAGLLVFDRTAVAGAYVGAALLGLFMIGISINLGRGRRPDCNCFGQIHSGPAGPSTLARNGLLMALALVVIATGQREAAGTAFSQFGDLDAATALAAAAVALALTVLIVQCWLAFHLLRQHGRLMLRVDHLERESGIAAPQPGPVGLPVGAPAPAFELPSVGGEQVTLSDLLTATDSLVLAFTEPGCQACRAVLPELGRRQRETGNPQIAVVASGAQPDDVRSMASRYNLELALVDRDGAVATAYEVPGTPAAVALSADGLVRSEIAGGPEAVQDLIDRLQHAEAEEYRLPVHRVSGGSGGNGRPGGAGMMIPDLELPALDGGTVSLREAVSGAPHILLFWSPTCGFCDAMLDDLHKLEQSDDPPPIVLIATGSAEMIRDQDLRSPTLLDSGFSGIGSAVQVPGTPAALRLDSRGRVVSDMAVGGESVLALAGVRAEPT